MDKKYTIQEFASQLRKKYADASAKEPNDTVFVNSFVAKYPDARKYIDYDFSWIDKTPKEKPTPEERNVVVQKGADQKEHEFPTIPRSSIETPEKLPVGERPIDKPVPEFEATYIHPERRRTLSGVRRREDVINEAAPVVDETAAENIDPVVESETIPEVSEQETPQTIFNRPMQQSAGFGNALPGVMEMVQRDQVDRREKFFEQIEQDEQNYKGAVSKLESLYNEKAELEARPQPVFSNAFVPAHLQEGSGLGEVNKEIERLETFIDLYEWNVKDRDKRAMDQPLNERQQEIVKEIGDISLNALRRAETFYADKELLKQEKAQIIAQIENYKANPRRGISGTSNRSGIDGELTGMNNKLADINQKLRLIDSEINMLRPPVAEMLEREQEEAREAGRQRGEKANIRLDDRRIIAEGMKNSVAGRVMGTLMEYGVELQSGLNQGMLHGVQSFYGYKAMMEDNPIKRQKYLNKSAEFEEFAHGYTLTDPDVMLLPDNPKRVGHWVAGQVGAMAPMVSAFMLSGLAGGKTGLMLTRSPYGAVAGSVMGSFSAGWLSYGGSLYTEMVGMGAKHEDSKRIAQDYAVPASLFSIAVPSAVSSAMLGAFGKQQVKSLMLHNLKHMAIGGVSEGLGETLAQTSVMMAHELATGKLYTTEEWKHSLINTYWSAWLMGVSMGSMSGKATYQQQQQKTIEEKVSDFIEEQEKVVQGTRVNLKDYYIETMGKLNKNGQLGVEGKAVLEFLQQEGAEESQMDYLDNISLAVMNRSEQENVSQLALFYSKEKSGELEYQNALEAISIMFNDPQAHKTFAEQALVNDPALQGELKLNFEKAKNEFAKLGSDVITKVNALVELSPVEIIEGVESIGLNDTQKTIVKEYLLYRQEYNNLFSVLDNERMNELDQTIDKTMDIVTPDYAHQDGNVHRAEYEGEQVFVLGTVGEASTIQKQDGSKEMIPTKELENQDVKSLDDEMADIAAQKQAEVTETLAGEQLADNALREMGENIIPGMIVQATVSGEPMQGKVIIAPDDTGFVIENEQGVFHVMAQDYPGVEIVEVTEPEPIRSNPVLETGDQQFELTPVDANTWAVTRGPQAEVQKIADQLRSEYENLDFTFERVPSVDPFKKAEYEVIARVKEPEVQAEQRTEIPAEQEVSAQIPQEVETPAEQVEAPPQVMPEAIIPEQADGVQFETRNTPPQDIIPEQADGVKIESEAGTGGTIEPGVVINPVQQSIIDAENQVHPNPSEKQKEAGNYKKGHVSVQGMDITIENPKGSTRSGTDADGNSWEITMNNTYGYFKRSKGKDGDQVDVFLGDNLESDKVFIVDQVNQDGSFDESKVMLGFESMEQARENYLANYEEGWQGLGNITEASIDAFKEWMDEGTQKRKPAAEYKRFQQETTPDGEGLAKINREIEEFKRKYPSDFTTKGALRTRSKRRQEYESLLKRRYEIASEYAESFPELARMEADKSREETQAINEAFEARQRELEGDLAGEQLQALRIEEKIVTGKELTSEEQAYANANFYRPEGYQFDKQGNLVKPEPGDRIAVEDGTLAFEDAKIRPDNRLQVDNTILQEYGVIKGGERYASDVLNPQVKIEDFGEKIEGAKKDLYVNASNADIAAQPLSKIFPRPDFPTLVAEGMLNEDGAYLLKFLYDNIPAKPRKKYRIDGWVKKVGQVIENYNEQLKQPEDGTRLKEGLLSSKYTTTAKEFADFIEVQKALGFPKEDVKTGGYAIKRFIGRSDYSIVKGSIILSDHKSIDAAASALKNILSTPQKKKTGLGVYRDTKTGKYFIGKKAALGVARVMDNIKSRSEAFDILTQQEGRLMEMWNDMKIAPEERRLSNRKREGVDYRKGSDITPEQFSETFGFRGVQFGNWVNQAERQQNLNEAYDALMDLASLTGIPAKGLSLGGELGFAFGARGSGKAMAHYEPGQVVINLTKTKGAGSLAHEWWHALDNHFSRKRGEPSQYLTEKPRQGITREGKPDERIRAEMHQAFKGVVDAIRKTDLPKRSGNIDMTRSKEYWGTMVEMSARAFEASLIDKMAPQSNDYLANFKELGEWNLDIDAYPYPLEAEMGPINTAFSDFFDTLKHKADGDNVTLFSIKQKQPVIDNVIPGTGKQNATDFMTEGELQQEGTRVYFNDKLTMSEGKAMVELARKSDLAAAWVMGERNGIAFSNETLAKAFAENFTREPQFTEVIVEIPEPGYYNDSKYRVLSGSKKDRANGLINFYDGRITTAEVVYDIAKEKLQSKQKQYAGLKPADQAKLLKEFRTDVEKARKELEALKKGRDKHIAEVLKGQQDRAELNFKVAIANGTREGYNYGLKDSWTDTELVQAENKAIERFGLTVDYKEAGWVLADGSLLDFSGKKEGLQPGTKNYDHSKIKEAIDFDLRNYKPRVLVMNGHVDKVAENGLHAFVDMGNIRLVPGNGLMLKHEPTREQYDAIRGFLETFKPDEKVYLELNGNQSETRAGEALKAIKDYFNPGYIPGLIDHLIQKGIHTRKDLENFVRFNDPWTNFKLGPARIYDNAEMAVMTTKMARGTKEQWKADLLKNGAKEYELDWKRFDDSFDDGQVIDRVDIEQWNRENKVEIEVIRKGITEGMTTGEYTLEAEQRDQELRDISRRWENLENIEYNGYELTESDQAQIKEWEEEYGTWMDIEEYHRPAIAENPDSYVPDLEGDTKYRTYTLAPGENYQEWLIRMPEGEFTTNHWNEKGILVHARMADHVSKDGKRVLVIHEMQSDWAQQGREEGFVQDKTKLEKEIETKRKELEEYDKKNSLQELWQNKRKFNKRMHDKYGTGWGVDNYAKLTLKEKTEQAEHERNISEVTNSEGRNALQQEITRLEILLENNVGVSRMPFSKTPQWLGLGMRHVIEYAVDNGYDGIAWGTGKQMGDVFSLRKQIESITYKPDSKDTFPGIVRAYPQDGGQIPIVKQVGNEKELAEVIGKELAEKIAKGARDIKGEGLEVGGEGMKGFYDGIIPSWVNKNLKKYGIKAGETKLDKNPEHLADAGGLDTRTGEVKAKPESDYLPVHYFPVNNNLHDAVAKAGMPMYKTGVQKSQAQYKKVRQVLEALHNNSGNTHDMLVLESQSEIVEAMTQLGEHPENIASVQKKLKEPGAVLHAFMTSSDTIYYIAENMPSDVTGITEVWLHEQGVHGGLRNLIPNDRDRRRLMDQVFTSVGEKGFEEMMGSTYEYYKLAPDWVKGEEYLGRLVEKMDAKELLTPVEKGVWEKFVKWINDILSRIYKLSVKFTDTDIRNLVKASVQSVIGHEQISQAAEPQAPFVSNRTDGSGVRFSVKGEKKEQRSIIYAPIEQGFKANTIGLGVKWLVDRWRPMNLLQNEILKRDGQVPEFANVYLAENRRKSETMYETEQFNQNEWKNLINNATVLTKALNKDVRNKIGQYSIDMLGLYPKDIYWDIVKHKDKREGETPELGWFKSLLNVAGKHLQEVIPPNEKFTQWDILSLYMQSKHAPERNFYQDMSLDVQDGSGIADADANNIVRMFEEIFPREDLRDLYATSPFSKYMSMEKFMKEFPSRAIHDFWVAKKAATDHALNSALKYGIISKEMYDGYMNRWVFYVPLRSWARLRPEEVFNYVNNDLSGKGYNPLRKQAKGRRSIADNPLPFIASIAHSAIVEGKKNEVKARLYTLMSLNPNMKDLFYLEKTWWVFDGQEWNETTQKPAQELWDAGRVKVKKSMDHYRYNSYQMGQQHELDLYIAGEKYIAVVGDPTIIKPLKYPVEKASEIMQRTWLSKFTRKLASWRTVQNPAFWTTNTNRDVRFALAIHLDEQGPEYLGNYIKNIPRSRKASHRYLRGKADPKNNKVDKYYDEWVKNGGPTGYSYMWKTEELTRQIQKDIKKLNDPQWMKMTDKINVVAIVSKWSEDMTKISEDITRFNTYLTSREAGKSIYTSVYESKESSGNFDKKGELTSFFASFYNFFNSRVQAGYRVMNLTRYNPLYWFTYGLITATKAFMQSMLYDLVAGEDEEGIPLYDKNSDYIKHKYGLIYEPLTGTTLSVPLGHNVSSFHAVGSLIYDVYSGRKTIEEAIPWVFDAAANSLAPLDVGSVLDEDGFITLRPIMPTAILPFYELNINQNFANFPITNEPFSRKQEDYHPEVMRHFKHVNPILKELAYSLFESGGGDREIPSKYYWEDGKLKEVSTWKDWNPAKIEHVMNHIAGGKGHFWMQMAKLSGNVILELNEQIKGSDKALFEGLSERMEAYDVPVVNRWIRTPKRDMLNRWYWDQRNADESFLNTMRLYRNSMEYEKYEEMKEDPMYDKIREREIIYGTIDDIRKHEEGLREIEMEIGLENIDYLESELLEKERRELMKETIDKPGSFRRPGKNEQP